MKKKGISTTELRRGGNNILAIYYYYLTVNVLYNVHVVISRLFLGSWKSTVFEALLYTFTLNTQEAIYAYSSGWKYR